MFKEDYERKRISCLNIIAFQCGFWKDYGTTTNVVISNPAHEEVHLIQHYVITFVSDLRQVDGFIQVFLFPTVQNWPRR